MSQCSAEPAGSQETAQGRVSRRRQPFGRTPIMALSDPRLSPIDKNVVAALDSFAWGDRATCWPGVANLAVRVGRSERTVQRAMRNLEHFGYVRVVPNGSLRTQREYLLLWKSPEGVRAQPAEPEAVSPRKRESLRTLDRLNQSMHLGVTKLVGAGVTKPSPELDELPEPDEVQSSIGGDDRRVSASPGGGGERKRPSPQSAPVPEPEVEPVGSIGECVEAARLHWGEAAAESTARREWDIARTCGGRFDLYAAALPKAAAVKDPPKNVDRLHAYCLRSALNAIAEGQGGGGPAACRPIASGGREAMREAIQRMLAPREMSQRLREVLGMAVFASDGGVDEHSVHWHVEKDVRARRAAGAPDEQIQANVQATFREAFEKAESDAELRERVEGWVVTAIKDALREPNTGPFPAVPWEAVTFFRQHAEKRFFAGEDPDAAIAHLTERRDAVFERCRFSETLRAQYTALSTKGFAEARQSLASGRGLLLHRLREFSHSA